MAKRPTTFEGRSSKKSLEDFQREALRAKYLELEALVTKYRRESAAFENTKTTQKDAVIRAFYQPRVDNLKHHIRSLIRLVYQIDSKSLDKKSVKGELVLVTSDEIPFYTLRAKIINAADSRWKPEYMTLYHNAVTGDGAQRGLTVRETKLKYWFSVEWADVIIDELLPRHKHEIVTD